MLNRGLIRFGLILEFIAEFLYFIVILYPEYFYSPPLILLIVLTYMVSSVIMYLGFNGYSKSLSIGSIGALLLVLGSSLLLMAHFTPQTYVITVISMGIAFLGDVSISMFFWKTMQRDLLIKIGAVLNAVPIITFIGSLLLAISLNHIEDSD
ncbi:hypothetical protein [Vulcanisaeta distributa]|uniref:hypothetical protein n=1 Tax=Vulcanisaeta distributa TaxID=164451 RepID=UPI0006CFC704|nr:hypothetical protein [Vulcanisaeta distributa]